MLEMMARAQKKSARARAAAVQRRDMLRVEMLRHADTFILHGARAHGVHISRQDARCF